MFTIRCSSDPPEAELAATPAGFTRLAEVIAGFAAGVTTETSFAVDPSDPATYERCLSGLRVERASGPLSVSVVGRTLVISGSSRALELLARNLPREPDLPPGYHVHIEAAGRESWVSPESVPLVLMVAVALDASQRAVPKKPE
ncbi:MAG: hypothetical protein ABI353_19270 [Isosphaeraceae bacterium]